MQKERFLVLKAQIFDNLSDILGAIRDPELDWDTVDKTIIDSSHAIIKILKDMEKEYGKETKD